MQHLSKDDPELAELIRKEESRVENSVDLIAAENHAPQSIMEALGSIFNTKTIEGYPSKRYYSGCEYVDIVERLAKKRGQKLFNAEYINVQPHSGSQANMAIYFSFIKPGDTILGMDLSHGGHLTHGSKVSFSGTFYRSVSYGLHPDNQLIDYDQVYKLAKEARPKMIIAGASAYPRVIDFQRFREIADEVGLVLARESDLVRHLV